ncbi:Rossmann-fold NAD(P)-binding domain-containing protein [Amycolatopsis thermophila]|uniref:NAD(P)-dependent dehydrogenase (Short-subunit alcohol dehydrogenase family) n=1 Tax=Amycolatopsis thermophila TaxID=206084 RepID=A0ABU0F2Z4_9PSEU|nr:hypothetical protein [Amycolatopsis thermophila]MDQ0381868.1 NAD(P)-dependent dehydrogenase (short-subunit alcohol dehydrogenase family) [Amycolatopsis thermophila]
MAGRKALILAGTGMLAGVAQVLTREGWHVVLPSRRYRPLDCEVRPGAAALRSLRSPGHRPVSLTGRSWGGGRAIWVEAHWDRPRELAAKAEMALHGPADLLVAWVHEQYRRSVLGAVETLLADDAPVVEVRNGPGGNEPPDPLLPLHPTQVVQLGTVSAYDAHRSLAEAEIAEGVLDAVRRALAGHATSTHQVGQLRPLVR